MFTRVHDEKVLPNVQDMHTMLLVWFVEVVQAESSRHMPCASHFAVPNRTLGSRICTKSTLLRFKQCV